MYSGPVVGAVEELSVSVAFPVTAVLHVRVVVVPVAGGVPVVVGTVSVDGQVRVSALLTVVPVVDHCPCSSLLVVV